MERLGKGIERELSRTGSRDAVPLAAITTAWPAAVGATVARQAWPLRLGRDGTLHVATASSTWAFELDRLAPEIHERLSSLLGPEAPPKLRFAVGPVPEPGVPPEAASSGVPDLTPPTPEVVAEADAAAATIDDPELRELVVRAARASLARARSGRHF